jgi:D-3-phosphoglycerate dehydrogenase / 2-oxoglutarate reductase
MNILIADTMHDSLFEMLKNESWNFDYRPDFKRADILRSVGNFDGLIIRSKTLLDRELLDAAGRLRFIGRAGAGLDLIDVDIALEKGIEVFHAGKGNRDAVGEHALGMLLALFNNIIKADREVRRGVWDREGNRGVELMGKTVGLIGYGNNGTATAQRLSGFGCEVLAYDKFRDQYGDHYAREASLDEIRQKADVLSLHVPLTDKTKYLIDESFIKGFAKPFYLMNLSRGEIVDLSAAAAALKSGKILGLCLDVLENEKMKSLTTDQQQIFDELAVSDRVVFSPHIGGWTHESYRRINQVLVDQISSWVSSVKG